MRPDERAGGRRWAAEHHDWACLAGTLLILWTGILGNGCASRVRGVPARETLRPEGGPSGQGQYITGTGCVSITDDPAADRLAADQAARAEVAKQMEVKIIQFVEDVQREEHSQDRRTAGYSISIQTKEFVDETLKGVRIRERRRDEERGLQCSVAVLDKKAAAARIRGEIDRALQEIRRALSGAKSARDEGRAVEALRGYTMALVSLGRVAVDVKLLRDLGERPPPIPSLVEVRRRWRGLLDGIRLEPIGGDRQRVRPGSPFPEPLRVKAMDRSGQAVSGLPLTVLRMPKGCSVQAGAWTDEAGEAAFRVYGVPARGKAIEEIGIGIDWKRLLTPTIGTEEGFPWLGWDTREVTFTCSLPVPADYRVGVAVFESGTGRPLEASPIQAFLLEGLQEAGFRTRDLFAGPLLRERPSSDQAVRILAGTVDILVTGEVSLRYSSESAGFVFYRARAVLEAVSLSNGRTLITLEREAKGGGLDETRAARKAVANLASKLKQEIAPALEKTLE